MLLAIFLFFFMPNVCRMEDAQIMITCDENNMRTLDPSPCPAEKAVLCQAVEKGSLVLECFECGKTSTVYWSGYPPNVGIRNHSRSSSGNTFFLESEQINSAAGCWTCECGENFNEKTIMHINVTVGPEDPLRFLINNAQSGVHIEFQPSDLTLSLESQGWISLQCNASGYPDPQYSWFYHDTHIRLPYENNSCLSTTSNYDQSLQFTLTPFNVESDTYQLYDYTCIVSNGLRNLTTTTGLHRDINIQAWVIHVHPKQNSSIILSNGTGTGVVAAYNDWYAYDRLQIKYEVCRIPKHLGLNSSMNPSCLRHKLVCCACRLNTGMADQNCPFKLSSRSIDLQDTDKLYFSTTGCEFQVREEMDIAVFAARCLDSVYICNDFNYSSNVMQFLGTIQVRNESSPASAPLGTVPPSASLYAASALGSALSFVAGMLLCAVCVWVIQRRRKKENQGRYDLLDQGSAGGGSDPGRRLREEGLAESCTDNRPVYDRVRSINEYLQKTLGVDSDLLASLTTHYLVSDNERELIYSMLQNGRPRSEITACFINNVLYNWPLERFRQHIQVLADILEEHTDAANQCCAQRLKGILN